jgi:hypothetical protein
LCLFCFRACVCVCACVRVCACVCACVGLTGGSRTALSSPGLPSAPLLPCPAGSDCPSPSPSPLYFQLLLRYDHGAFYPGFIVPSVGPEAGAPTFVGRGPPEALGRCANVGWCGHGDYGAPAMGDGDYAAAWAGVVMPLARWVTAYAAQLLLGSCLTRCMSRWLPPPLPRENASRWAPHGRDHLSTHATHQAEGAAHWVQVTNSAEQRMQCAATIFRLVGRVCVCVCACVCLRVCVCPGRLPRVWSLCRQGLTPPGATH